MERTTSRRGCHAKPAAQDQDGSGRRASERRESPSRMSALEGSPHDRHRTQAGLGQRAMQGLPVTSFVPRWMRSE